MKILYISQYFPPEAGATQTRAFENARYLKAQGHDVTVLCEIPNHPAGIVFKGYRKRLYQRRVLQGIEVLYVWVFTSPVKNFATRMAFYLSFMTMASVAGMFLLRKRFDLIYATSPPLPAAGAGLWLSFCRKTSLFFEVRDLWPDSAVALGELNNPAVIKLACRLEAACYARAVKIIAVTKGIQKALIQEKNIARHKVALVPNGATTDSFFRDSRAGARLRADLGLDNRFVVLYAGILGIAQNLETMLYAAQALRDHKEVHFLIAGAGPKKAALKSLASALGLDNLDFLEERPRHKMPPLYSAVDAALVPLSRKKLFRHARPSKLFDAWACETPVLLGIQGEARNLMDQCSGGLSFEPDNAKDLAQKIIELNHMPETDRRSMGRKARAFVKSSHSRKVYAQKLEKTLGSGLQF